MSEMDLPVSSTTSFSENLVIVKQEPDFGPPIKEEIFEHVHIKQEEGLDLYQPNEPLVKLEEFFKSEEMDSQEFLDDLSKQQIEIKNEYEISSSTNLVKEERNLTQSIINNPDNECDIEENSIKNGIHECHECEFQYCGHLDQDKILEEAEIFKCLRCTFKTTNKCDLDNHVLCHKNNAKIRLYKCRACNYQSADNKDILKHLDSHPGIVPTYKCQKCDYLGKTKVNLKMHDQRRHQGLEEGKLYKCNDCDYQSMGKIYFKRHILRHKKVDPYRCNECDYKTIQKRDYKKHMARHKKPEEVDIFKCNKCDYQSIHKYHLDKHLVYHMDPDEMKMYKCTECSFQSKRKTGLNRHMLDHRKTEDIEWHKCSDCNYQSMHKDSLRRHIRRHKDLQEYCTYNCNECHYTTIYKDQFRKHVRHKHPEKIQTNKSSVNTHLPGYKESEKTEGL